MLEQIATFHLAFLVKMNGMPASSLLELLPQRALIGVVSDSHKKLRIWLQPSQLLTK
jgi:hypothetical protein